MSIEVKGANELARGLERVASRIAKKQDYILTRHVTRVREWISSNTHKLFDTGGKIGTTGLWQTEPIITGDTASVEGIWQGEALAYGYVLERGPKTKRKWTIVPGKSVVSGKYPRAGLPTIRLRFQHGSRIIYKKRIEYTWTKKQLRPHWKPALKDKGNKRALREDIKETVRDAFKAEGMKA